MNLKNIQFHKVLKSSMPICGVMLKRNSQIDTRLVANPVFRVARLLTKPIRQKPFCSTKNNHKTNLLRMKYNFFLIG